MRFYAPPFLVWWGGCPPEQLSSSAYLRCPRTWPSWKTWGEFDARPGKSKAESIRGRRFDGNAVAAAAAAATRKRVKVNRARVRCCIRAATLRPLCIENVHAAALALYICGPRTLSLIFHPRSCNRRRSVVATHAARRELPTYGSSKAQPVSPTMATTHERLPRRVEFVAPDEGISAVVVEGEVEVVLEHGVASELDGPLVAPENIAVIVEQRVALEPVPQRFKIGQTYDRSNVGKLKQHTHTDIRSIMHVS